MAIFVEVEEDPWEVNASNQVQELNSGVLQEFAVRRPTRGIEVREPTYSFMRVVDRFGRNVLLRNSSDPSGLGIGYYTSNYLLQSLTYNRSEKIQIVETFGENFIFAYGERPIQAQITGGLVHSNDFQWPVEFWNNYQEVFRGTRLAEMGARLYLYVDGMLLEGLAVQANDNRASDQPNIVPFNMTVLVTNISFLDAPTMMYYPIRRTAVQDMSLLTGVDGWQRLMSMAQSERSQYLEKEYGVRAKQVTEARYRKQKALERTEQALGLLYESAVQGPNSKLMFQTVVDPSFLDALDPPPAAASNLALKRRLPIRSRIIDNIDEYVQGVPGQSSTDSAMSQAEAAGAVPTMDQGEAADEAGLSPEPEADMSFDEATRDPPTADEASTTLPETVGADPGADVASGSGVVTGRDLPAWSEGA